MRFALGLLLLGLAALSVIAFGVGMVLTGFTHPVRTGAAAAAPITPPPDTALPANLVPPSVGNPPVLPAGSTAAPATAPTPTRSAPPQQPLPPLVRPRGTPVPGHHHHPSPLPPV